MDDTGNDDQDVRPNPTFVTARMVLRPFRADDLESLVALDADPGVKAFIDGGLPVDRADVEDTLQHWMRFASHTPGYGCWAADDRATGRFVGWFHLRPHGDDPHDRPELGYRLHRHAWGRGLGTEGSVELLRHAFETMGASSVYAETMVVNTGSRRVMEKAGMRHVRTFFADWPVRIPGDEHGDVTYEITRDEWLAGRGGQTMRDTLSGQ
ncbi:MAG: GNAT family N-acetyltransferase [Acidimicrobiales bacterium]